MNQHDLLIFAAIGTVGAISFILTLHLARKLD